MRSPLTGEEEAWSHTDLIQHTGSALFAVPPGVAEGDYIGSTLFGG